MARSNAYFSAEVESGLILLDSSDNIIALDEGAAIILKCYRNRKRQPAYTIEPSILEALQRVSDPSCSDRTLLIDFEEFSCQTYALKYDDASVEEPLLAVLIERPRKPYDAIDEVGVEYGLTRREQETIRGLSAGLSTKVVADRMNIKPSTVRAFLRLIKIKMGVPNRSDIMIKILQRQC